MARVITFSRQFQQEHPRAGEATFFMEKLWVSLKHPANYYDLVTLNPGKEKEAEKHWSTVKYEWMNLAPKHHTIRGGNRFKVGDKFSPRVWGTDINPKTGRSGPYHSKQITIAPDIEVKQVWNIEINCRGGAAWFEVIVNGKLFAQLHHGYDKDKNRKGIERMARNDGLSIEDFEEWFYASISLKKPFVGQIICWSDEVNY